MASQCPSTVVFFLVSSVHIEQCAEMGSRDHPE